MALNIDAGGLDSSVLASLLKLLADGEYHSGEELGAVLGVSRAAVWKRLKKLEVIGLAVTSLKGKGYRITGGLELLDKEFVERQLAESGLSAALSLKLLPIIDSTNSYLLRQPRVAGEVCAAELQTAGRGRRGRTWVGSFGQSLYLSLGWGFDGGVTALEGLSLAVGVAVCRCLSRLGFANTKLKWPNDILCHNKKLGGILIEISGDLSGYCQAVIGIGLNIQVGSLVDQHIDQPWIDLKSLCDGRRLPANFRNQLLVDIILELTRVLSNYQADGFEAYSAEWNALNAYAGKGVSLISGPNTIRGTMLGVNQVGALCLHTANGEELFHGGELSLRLSL